MTKRSQSHQLEDESWRPLSISVPNQMAYISINFPSQYSKDEKVFLKNVLAEKDRVRFSAILIKKILVTQVEK